MHAVVARSPIGSGAKLCEQLITTPCVAWGWLLLVFQDKLFEKVTRLVPKKAKHARSVCGNSIQIHIRTDFPGHLREDAGRSGPI